MIRFVNSLLDIVTSLLRYNKNHLKEIDFQPNLVYSTNYEGIKYDWEIYKTYESWLGLETEIVFSTQTV